MDQELVQAMRERDDYDADAIAALAAADTRYTLAEWEREVCAAMEEDGVGFREAVYIALVENYLDAQN